VASLEGIVEFLSTCWLGNNWHPTVAYKMGNFDGGGGVGDEWRVCVRVLSIGPYSTGFARCCAGCTPHGVLWGMVLGVRWWCVSTSCYKSKSLFFQHILSHSRIQFPPLILERLSAVPL